jgi:hypothetical protein
MIRFAAPYRWCPLRSNVRGLSMGRSLLSAFRFSSVDRAFLQNVSSIGWFRLCGQPPALTLPFVVQPVHSWHEAVAACQSEEGRSANLEARNELSSFLHEKHPRRFQRWNDLADDIKRACIAPLASEVWQPFAQRNNLPAAFVDCVSWQVLAAAVENEYRECQGLPMYFSHLLQVYRHGHFPCGWIGRWPQGKLLVL